jgi:DNA-binding CsgD family transcriptional regulator
MLAPFILVYRPRGLLTTIRYNRFSMSNSPNAEFTSTIHISERSALLAEGLGSGFSQTDLGDMFGSSRETVNRWLNNAHAEFGVAGCGRPNYRMVAISVLRGLVTQEATPGEPFVPTVLSADQGRRGSFLIKERGEYGIVKTLQVPIVEDPAPIGSIRLGKGEQEVIASLCNGKNVPWIALTRSVEEGTVKHQLQRARAKLGVGTTDHLIAQTLLHDLLGRQKNGRAISMPVGRTIERPAYVALKKS